MEELELCRCLILKADGNIAKGYHHAPNNAAPAGSDKVGVNAAVPACVPSQGAGEGTCC